MATLIWALLSLVAAAPPPSGPPSPQLLAALSDARSAEPARHARLRVELGTASFLALLDSPRDYERAARVRLHVDEVAMSLARNPASSARDAFVDLTTDATYLADEERVIGLILASAEVRPAPPALVRFWDAHSRRDDGFLPTTIVALTDNGSEKAMALLQRKLASSTFSADEKRAWMRGPILVHRNDLPLLRACGHLLTSGLKKELRPALVEALFDYRPEAWYRPSSSYSPPPLEQASAESRSELRRLAKLALETVALSGSQRAAVQRRLRDLAAPRPADAP